MAKPGPQLSLRSRASMRLHGVSVESLNYLFRYYTLSAVCALFKHSEMKLNVRYAARSLRIRYTPVDGTMLIDNDSARNLEVVGNMLNKKSSHSLYG